MEIELNNEQMAPSQEQQQQKVTNRDKVMRITEKWTNGSRLLPKKNNKNNEKLPMT